MPDTGFPDTVVADTGIDAADATLGDAADVSIEHETDGASDATLQDAASDVASDG